MRNTPAFYSCVSESIFQKSEGEPGPSLDEIASRSFLRVSALRPYSLQTQKLCFLVKRRGNQQKNIDTSLLQTNHGQRGPLPCMQIVGAMSIFPDPLDILFRLGFYLPPSYVFVGLRITHMITIALVP